MEKPKIRLGLCCINNTLRKRRPTTFCSRNTIRSNFSVERAKDLANENCDDILRLLKWNEEKAPNLPIRVFRLSSNVFPRFTDKEVESYSIDFAKEKLKKAGDYAKEKGHRILMHPGQYNQVGADKQSVFESTELDLSHHADILNAMGISEEDGVLIVHGGGTYGNKERTMRRWCEQFSDLPQKVRKRLVLENDERQYSVDDCLEICNEIGIPMIYDCHHNACYRELHPDEKHTKSTKFIPKILETWKDNRRPVVHVSEQREGQRVGAHSDYIERIPNHVLNIARIHNRSFDLEVEAKAKEAAIDKLIVKYLAKEKTKKLFV